MTETRKKVSDTFSGAQSRYANPHGKSVRHFFAGTDS
jgi:hypothetical protein